MKKSTLCFCLQDDQVLLAMKKRDFGEGKWNGYGGKVREDEDPKTAAIREIEEESSLIVARKDLEQVALVRFYFESNPVFECFVFVNRSWQNEPVETDEMRPQWYAISDIPLSDMWAGDAKWVPLILNGEKIEAEVNYNAEGNIVKEFSYKSAEFA